MLNAQNQTALEVAACPRNPCKQENQLRRVVALLDGTEGLSEGEEEQEEERGSGSGASKGLFLQAKDSSTLSGQGKPGGGGAAKGKMAAEEGAGSGGGGGGTGKEEDVYEFKTSSKEATPASSRGSASPGSKEEGKEGEAAKRSKEEEGEEGGEDGKQRKKRKDEGGAGRGRGVRGASIEKTVGKVGGARGRGAASADRKSPPAGRAEPPGPAPSPGKGKAGKQEAPTPPAAPAQNPEEETDSDGDKSGKGEAGPKVPPLKIVLNSGTNGREEDKKKNYIVNNGSEDGESSEGKTEGAEGGTGEGQDKAGRGERVTRSRGQQGGEEEGQQSEAAREEQARQDNEYHIKKRKLRGGAGAEDANASNSGIIRQAGEPPTDIEKHLNIRKQIEQRRKNLFPVQPKPPQGFKDYLMNKKTYHLQGNTGKDSRIQPIPKIAPPPSLEGPLRELFLQQEDARYKLRMNHLVEKEKLVLSVEQEILRVHGRAARALANQPLPYSVCTFMRDENVYTPIDPCQEEKNRDIRSRYNGRLFLSWLQDVDDKWEKIKVTVLVQEFIYGGTSAKNQKSDAYFVQEQMVLRHHNEAESLNAVQKMDWEWKLQEINSGIKVKPAIDDLHVPMVQVNEDFDQLVS